MSLWGPEPPSSEWERQQQWRLSHLLVASGNLLLLLHSSAASRSLARRSKTSRGLQLGRASPSQNVGPSLGRSLSRCKVRHRSRQPNQMRFPADESSRRRGFRSSGKSKDFIKGNKQQQLGGLWGQRGETQSPPAVQPPSREGWVPTAPEQLLRCNPRFFQILENHPKYWGVAEATR